MRTSSGLPASARNWCGSRSASRPPPTSSTISRRHCAFRKRSDPMKLSVNGTDVFVATGGRDFDKSLPAVLYLDGADFDRSTWPLHTHWFAHNGFSVLAMDLPAHGRSPGPAL